MKLYWSLIQGLRLPTPLVPVWHLQGGEGDDREWDSWIASPTQWTWVWVNSGSWWWTGRPGVLQFMGSQRVRHNWATELNWTECILKGDYKSYKVEDLIVHPLLSLLSCSSMSNLPVTPWTAALQTPLSMGFPRQENWSGLLSPSSRDLPNRGIEPKSPALAGRFFTTEPPGKPSISLTSLFFSCSMLQLTCNRMLSVWFSL